MNSLFRALILLLLFIFIIFGMDKIYPGITALSIHAVLYFFIAGIILIPVIFPIVLQLPRVILILSWLLLYIVSLFLIYPQEPIWGGIISYVTVIEGCLLTLAVILSSDLVQKMKEFDIFHEKFFKPLSTHEVRDLNNSVDDIKAELNRSRRYNHPLSILVVEPSDLSMKENQQIILKQTKKKMVHRFFTLSLAELISQQSRRFDMIFTHSWDGRFYIICPENSIEGTRKFAQRISDEAKEKMGVRLNCGFAVFPNDALTFEELMKKAENGLAIDSPNLDQNNSLLTAVESGSKSEETKDSNSNLGNE